jgi:predicted Zn-dependent protease
MSGVGRRASGFGVGREGLRLGLVLAGSFAVVSTFACAGMPSAAGLGRVGQAALPIGPVKEREIGFGIAATVAGRYRLVDNPVLNEYVSLVGATVAEQSIRGAEVEFHFGVLDTDDVNAFAAPGGYILITRGALALMESEAELAGVLAHEVAHVDEKHVLNDIRQQGVMNTAQDEAQLSGALLDRISGAGAGLLFGGLSREAEEEADSLGMLYASAVGYRPDGMMQFLEHLAAKIAEEQADGASGGWTASHRAPTERVEAIRADIAARGMRPDQGVSGSDRFRARVRL